MCIVDHFIVTPITTVFPIPPFFASLKSGDVGGGGGRLYYF